MYGYICTYLGRKRLKNSRFFISLHNAIEKLTANDRFSQATLSVLCS